MKTLALFLSLVSFGAMAQTYNLTVNLDGYTYQGDFTWTAAMVGGSQGELEPGPGVYSNVSISNPSGALTSAFDIYEGADYNVNQHEIWFSNPQNVVMGVNIPEMGGTSVPVLGVLVYNAPGGGLNYESCTVCDASITEVVSNSFLKAPELDPANGIAATTLLGCIVLVLRAGRPNLCS